MEKKGGGKEEGRGEEKEKGKRGWGFKELNTYTRKSGIIFKFDNLKMVVYLASETVLYIMNIFLNNFVNVCYSNN